MYREGGIIGSVNTPSGFSLPGTASGLWTINEIQVARINNTWPDFLITETTVSLNTIENVPIHIVGTISTADSTKDYNVVDVKFTSGSTAGHKFYIQVRIRGTT